MKVEILRTLPKSDLYSPLLLLDLNFVTVKRVPLLKSQILIWDLFLPILQGISDWQLTRKFHAP